MSVAGRSVTISLHAAEVPAVEAALARYRSARDAVAAQADAGVAGQRAAGRRRRGR